MWDKYFYIAGCVATGVALLWMLGKLIGHAVDHHDWHAKVGGRELETERSIEANRRAIQQICKHQWVRYIDPDPWRRERIPEKEECTICGAVRRKPKRQKKSA